MPPENKQNNIHITKDGCHVDLYLDIKKKTIDKLTAKTLDIKALDEEPVSFTRTK